MCSVKTILATAAAKKNIIFCNCNCIYFLEMAEKNESSRMKSMRRIIFFFTQLRFVMCTFFFAVFVLFACSCSLHVISSLYFAANFSSAFLSCWMSRALLHFYSRRFFLLPLSTHAVMLTMILTYLKCKKRFFARAFSFNRLFTAEMLTEISYLE